MNITTAQLQGNKPVMVMKLVGELDASCYLDVIAAASLAHQFQLPLLPRTAGSSLAGQAVNEALVNPDDGWGAMHDIAHDVDQTTGFATHCKLLRPQPRVAKTLTITGFNQILQIFNDQDEALASF